MKRSREGNISEFIGGNCKDANSENYSNVEINYNCLSAPGLWTTGNSGSVMRDGPKILRFENAREIQYLFTLKFLKSSLNFQNLAFFVIFSKTF